MEILLILAVVIIGVGSVFWNMSRSKDILQQWADENGYRVTESGYAWFFKGPFFWTSTKGQSVYHVVVEDQAGRTRSGWVRCGSWMWGILSDQAEVRWDD